MVKSHYSSFQFRGWIQEECTCNLEIFVSIAVRKKIIHVLFCEIHVCILLYFVRGLLNNKYIRKCVELSDSTQLEKRKRIQSASTTVSDAGEIALITVKVLKLRTPEKIAVNILKICIMWLFHRVVSPKDADWMANSVDPDQTAPRGAVWSGSTLFAYAYLSENLGSLRYSKNPKFWDRQAWANSADPDQTAPIGLLFLLHLLDALIILLYAKTILFKF